jgi:hypothetical protein
MKRTWGTGAYAFLEPVGIVDVREGATLNVYLNGTLVPQAGNWWIDSDLRTLKFAYVIGAGQTITADFSFFYFCRFLDDELPLEEFFQGYWSIKSLRFRSTVADPSPPAGSIFAPGYTIPNQDNDLITPQGTEPTQKLWRYAPSFPSGNPDYSQTIWNGRRSDVDTGFPSTLFPSVLDPRETPIPEPIPDYPNSSFLIRVKLYYIYSFPGVAETVFQRIVFTNATLEPEEDQALGEIVGSSAWMPSQSGREQVYFATVDHDFPLSVRIETKWVGSVGIVSPAANPANDPEPYHTDDSYLIIEWFSGVP